MAIEPWTHQGEFSNPFVVVDEDDVVTSLEVVSYINFNASFGSVGRNCKYLVNL